MRYYLRWLDEYVIAVLIRWDTGVGVLGTIIAFFKASPGVALAVALITLAESTYGVYRKERQMRSARDEQVHFSAKSGSFTANLPDPGPTRASFRIHVFWELTVTCDVSTDRLGLNIYVRTRQHWWQFWERKEKGIKGLPPVGKDSTQYRVRIDKNEIQPHKGDAKFEYEYDREVEITRAELVLLTLVPIEGRFLASVKPIDWDELHQRGTNPPL